MEKENKQENLEIGIGNKEAEKLTPKTVKIASVQIRLVGEKGHKKVVCTAIYPGRDETIDISSVKYERNSKLVETGLFVNLEKKDNEKDPDKLQKNSALAVFMAKLGVSKVSELEGKDAETVEGERGYLCFKAY